MNISFDLLPDHIRILPGPLQRQALEDTLLGENGLLNYRSEHDKDLGRGIARALFNRLFPPGQTDPVRSGLEEPDRKLLGEMFEIAFTIYRPGILASLFRKLFEKEGKLLQLSIGERLTHFIGAMGFVPVKLAQLASENPALVKNARLREHLGSLKDDAPPVSNLAVVETLIASGLAYEEIEVGKRLAQASIKQVNIGRLRVIEREGIRWRDVVHKILRPDLLRRAEQDIKVLEVVLPHINSRYPIDTEQLITAVRKILKEESDFNHEIKNAEQLSQQLSKLDKQLAVRLPENLTPSHLIGSAVIVEERVFGVELGTHIRLANSRKALLDLCQKRGLPKSAISRLFNQDPQIPRERLLEAHMNCLYRYGVAHADLHGSNALNNGISSVIIDAGLLVTVSSSKLPAIREIAKGALLRDAERTTKGIVDFLSDQSSSETIEQLGIEVQEALKKLEFAEALTELGRIVLRIPAKQEDLNTLARCIKAQSQALWLSRFEYPAAIRTLEIMATALEMSPAEVRLAMWVNWRETLYSTFHASIPGRLLHRAGDSISIVISKMLYTRVDIRSKIKNMNLLINTRHSSEKMLELINGSLASFSTTVSPIQDPQTRLLIPVGKIPAKFDGSFSSHQDGVEALAAKGISEQVTRKYLINYVRSLRWLSTHFVSAPVRTAVSLDYEHYSGLVNILYSPSRKDLYPDINCRGIFLVHCLAGSCMEDKAYRFLGIPSPQLQRIALKLMNILGELHEVTRLINLAHSDVAADARLAAREQGNISDHKIELSDGSERYREPRGEFICSLAASPVVEEGTGLTSVAAEAQLNFIHQEKLRLACADLVSQCLGQNVSVSHRELTSPVKEALIDCEGTYYWIHVTHRGYNDGGSVHIKFDNLSTGASVALDLDHSKLVRYIKGGRVL